MYVMIVKYKRIHHSNVDYIIFPNYSTFQTPSMFYGSNETSPIYTVTLTTHNHTRGSCMLLRCCLNSSYAPVETIHCCLFGCAIFTAAASIGLKMGKVIMCLIRGI